MRGFCAAFLHVDAVCFFRIESSCDIEGQIQTHNLSFWIKIGAVTTAKYEGGSVLCFNA